MEIGMPRQRLRGRGELLEAKMLLPISIITGSVVAGAAASYYASYAVRSQWLGPTIWRGRADTNEVALTFDDGPGEDTEELLEVLGNLKVNATFFMIGHHVDRHPRIARRVAEFGHEIGNHSYLHPILLYRSAGETRGQIQRAQKIISETTGVRPVFARPPCGVRTRAYFAATRELNLETVQWSDTGFDWKHHDAERIARDAVRHARAGSIILLHDGDSAGKSTRKQTIAAVPLIVEELKTRGLEIAPLNRLIDMRSQPQFAAQQTNA
jgi:peptidoglycan/xylan/chitin deacetylase (PgdA/CDA1 family)